MKKLVFLFVFILSGCAQPDVSQIVVNLYDVTKKQVGTASLKEGEGGVDLSLEVKGLSPGEHGFHIHETGKCTDSEFKSAGGHFNPTGKEHGLNNEHGAHLGDLNNIRVNEEGTAKVEIHIPGVTLLNGKYALLEDDGTALIIHEEADDGKSNPSGNAGKRIVCGEIALIK